MLARRLSGLSARRPGLALGLWGPPGVGKTHTALALLRGVTCRSLTVHASQPLETIALRLPRPDTLASWLERRLERIEHLEPIGNDTLLQVLAGVLAANAPFILHVEDLHEASDDHLAFWQQIAATVKRLPGVGLLVTSRLRPPEPLEEIPLSALNREESDALLETEVGAALPPDGLAWMYEHALGNPLFSLEYLRFLSRQGMLWNDGQRWRWRTPEREFVPVTIEALIEQMMRKHADTPVLEAALNAKAMLGLNTSQHLWHEATGLSLTDFLAAQETLRSRGVFSSGEFVHPLYGEVVSRNLSRPERQAMARRILEALQDEPQQAARFIDDANLEPEARFDWLLRAAATATQAGRLTQAAKFQAQAVRVAPREQQESLVLQAARILQAFDPGETSRLLELIPVVASTSGEFIVFSAEFWAKRGDLERAVTLLEQLPASAQDTAAWTGHRLRLHALANDFAGAVQLWESNPDLTSDADVNTLTQAGIALTQTGQHAAAETLVRAALERSALSLDARGSLQNLLAAILAYQARVPEALEIWDALMLTWEDERFAVQRAAALSNCAQMRARMGALERAAQNARDAVKTALEVNNLNLLAQAQVILGDIQIKQGAYEEAQLGLQELHVLLGDKPQVQRCNVEFALSVLYQHWSTPQSAYLQLRYARRALETATALQNPMHISTALSLVAVAEVSASNVGRALEHAHEALGRAEQLQHPVLRMNALSAKSTALEASAQTADALSTWAQALALAEQYGLQEARQQIRFDVARATGDLATIHEVRAWFAQQGLQNSVDLIDRSFPTQPTTESHPEPPLARLEVLGTVQVRLEGTVTPVRGRKRQELLAMLLEARVSGRGEISKLELMDALYPQSDETQASTGLRDVIYQLRSSLGSAAITTTANGYALGNLSSDLEAFLEHGDTRLWRGAYLAGVTLSGSDLVRENVHLALRARAETLIDLDPLEAARIGRLLCDADPYDLEALRLTLTGLRAGGNHRSLSRVYEAARPGFLEIGEALPARWQDFLTRIGATP